MKRCPSTHPMWGGAMRCEEPEGHLDEQRPHFNSFYMRSWEEPERCGPVNVTAGSGMWDTFTCVLEEFHSGDHVFAGEEQR